MRPPTRRALPGLPWPFALVVLLFGCAASPPPPGAFDPTNSTGSTSPQPAAHALQHQTLATVLIFVRIDCPISNRYAPEVNRLHARFEPARINFTLVYPDPNLTAEDIQRHCMEYGYRMPAHHDPRHDLVRGTGVTVTPEAVIYDHRDRLVYRGRIDDRFVAFGVTRRHPTTHDLEDILQALVQGDEIEPRSTKAIGCFIADLR